MEDFVPDFFDPFGEYQYDFSSLAYDPETDFFTLNDKPITLNQEQQQIVQTTINQQQDPIPPLREALQQQMASNQPTDPADLMPNTIFQEQPNGTIYFPDSCFAAPVIASKQNLKRKNITGFILLPATYAARIRSRNANHSKPTPVLYLPQEFIPDEMRAQFESLNK